LGNSTISGYEYSYYLDGSDACKVRNENGIIETTEYEYDGLRRLTEESVKVGDNTTDTYAYEYDDYGNRSKMTATGSENYVTEYNYNNAQGKYTALLQKEIKTVQGENNALNNNSNVKQTVYTYDANGNQITKTADGKTETNTYDGLNQLIGFTDGETTASYKYNVSGLRIEKVVNGQRINHVWDGSKQIVADIVEGDTYNANCYVRGTSLAAKYKFVNGAKSEYTYYTQNAHGDVVNLTNADGEVVKSYTYDAFGVEKNISDSDSNPFRYCGEYFDSETGTIYLRARYYNPTIGRFISRDSYAGRKSDPLSLNLYTYCANNPIANVDPSGHSYGTLPDGTKFSINSNSDAEKFQIERENQLSKQPTSFDAYLAVHKVAGDNYHTSIVIFANGDFGNETISQGKEYFINEYKNLFKNANAEGLKYVTLGAGTNGLFNFFPKDLVSKPNRKKDIMLENKVQMIDLKIESPYVAYQLIACQRHYEKAYNEPIFPFSRVNYDLFPAYGYNSNSFTHGLLNAVGIDVPDPSYNVPGWEKPLPNSYFGRFNEYYFGLHQDKVDSIEEVFR